MEATLVGTDIVPALDVLGFSGGIITGMLALTDSCGVSATKIAVNVCVPVKTSSVVVVVPPPGAARVTVYGTLAQTLWPPPPLYDIDPWPPTGSPVAAGTIGRVETLLLVLRGIVSNES
jgi:hypothetical protein